MLWAKGDDPESLKVSMKSGLEGRNNGAEARPVCVALVAVSMKSGLEGRNNWSA